MAARKSAKSTMSTPKSSSMMKMNSLQMVSWLLVTVGAVNWGLVGLANVNLVEALLGMWPALVQIVYILVGLAGLYSLWGMFTMGK